MLSQHALQVVSQHALQVLSQHALQWGDLLLGVCSREGVPALGGGSLLRGGACSRGVETPLRADGYFCRPYASYWNAFFIII